MSDSKITSGLGDEIDRLLNYTGPMTREVAYQFHNAGISLTPDDPRYAAFSLFERMFEAPFRANPRHLLALARYAMGDTEPRDQFDREAIDDLAYMGVFNQCVGEPRALSRRGRLALKACLLALDAIDDDPRLKDQFHDGATIHHDQVGFVHARAEDCKRQPRPPIDPASN